MGVKIYQSDVLHALSLIESDTIDCIVTSPPYWGLRDYGVNGQLGLESSLADHINIMVAVFNELKRVLKPTGVCWWNYGDTWAAHPNGRAAADIEGDNRKFTDKPFSTVGPVYNPTQRGEKRYNKNQTASNGRVCAGGYIKPKDMCLIPERLVIAFQDQGWWIRSRGVWNKTNPMPSSVKDRPAPSHELFYMMTKASKYWFDMEAVRQPATSVPETPDLEPWGRSISSSDYQSPAQRVAHPSVKGWAGEGVPHNSISLSAAKRMSFKRDDSKREKPLAAKDVKGTHRPDRDDVLYGADGKRNWRDVWQFAVRPGYGGHIAAFPEELIEPLIKSSCPEGGVVLDPFGGSGTTAVVADYLKRDSILIELNPDYANLAKQRLIERGGMFTTVDMIACPKEKGAVA